MGKFGYLSSFERGRKAIASYGYLTLLSVVMLRQWHLHLQIIEDVPHDVGLENTQNLSTKWLS